MGLIERKEGILGVCNIVRMGMEHGCCLSISLRTLHLHFPDQTQSPTVPRK